MTFTKLKSAIANLKSAGDVTPAQGVGFSGSETTEEITPLSILQNNTDEFVALLQDMPSKSDIKQNILKLHSSITTVQDMLDQISKNLKDILEPGDDSRELAKIKATSGLNEFASLLETYSKELKDVQDLASTMKSLAGKYKEISKFKPVHHKLPHKEPIKTPKPETSTEETK